MDVRTPRRVIGTAVLSLLIPATAETLVSDDGNRAMTPGPVFGDWRTFTTVDTLTRRHTATGIAQVNRSEQGGVMSMLCLGTIPAADVDRLELAGLVPTNDAGATISIDVQFVGRTPRTSAQRPKSEGILMSSRIDDDPLFRRLQVSYERGGDKAFHPLEVLTLRRLMAGERVLVVRIGEGDARRTYAFTLPGFDDAYRWMAARCPAAPRAFGQTAAR